MRYKGSKASEKLWRIKNRRSTWLASSFFCTPHLPFWCLQFTKPSKSLYLFGRTSVKGAVNGHTMFTMERKRQKQLLQQILQVEHELTTLRTSTIIIARHRKLTAKITHGIFIKVGHQFKLYGLTHGAIADVPDATSKGCIYHRPYLVLCAPDCIVVSHWSSSFW